MSLLNFFGFTEPLAAYNPAHDFWYDSATGYVMSRQTTAGVRVNEDRALNYSVCWAATRLLAGTAGWLPFNLYKRLPAGGANIDSKHGVHRIIHSQPNRDMGAMMFRARGVNHQVNSGNTFAEIRRTVGGDAFSLEPIHPWRIPPQNIKREDDGSLVYLVYRPDGVGSPQRVGQDDMFHVPSIISDDGIIGKGVVTAARESIGKAIGTQIHGAAALNHGGAPPLALKNGKFKTKEDREEFRRQLKERHGGPQNAGEWLLLPPDAEVQMLGFNLRDSQFLESQNFDIEEIARWYGVPPHLVGHLLRATFNNIEELGISFVKYSLIQWLKLWEQEVWRKLLNEREKDTHYAKFVVDALERGNLATRTEAGVKKFFNGLWTLNAWAEQEDMNPITETVEIDGQQVNLGDVRFVQQAMIPLAMAAKGEGLKGGDQPTQDGQKNEPPPQQQPETNADNADEEIRSQVATVTASTALLSQSVERVVAAVGGLQSDGQRLSEAIEGVQSTVTQLATTVHENHSAALKALEANAGAIVTLQAEIAETSIAHAAIQQQVSVALVRDVLARLLSVEVHNIKNIAQTASKFDQRLLSFYDKHRKTMEQALLGPCEAALIASRRHDNPALFVTSFIDGHVADSMQQLLALCDCQAEELPKRIEDCVGKWNGERTTIPIGG